MSLDPRAEHLRGAGGPAGDGAAVSRQFAAAVRTGAPWSVRPEDAVHVLRVLEAAARSSSDRWVVRVSRS